MPDVELALHCISDLGSVDTPSCPIIAERTRAMLEPCDGLSITDKLFDFAVQSIIESSTAKKKKRRELWGQIDAFCYSVALIRNPYDPNWEDVRRDANSEAAARMDD